jgi:hypothetical protein
MELATLNVRLRIRARGHTPARRDAHNTVIRAPRVIAVTARRLAQESWRRRQLSSSTLPM